MKRQSFTIVLFALLAALAFLPGTSGGGEDGRGSDPPGVSAPQKTVPAARARAAVERSLALLQSSQRHWTEEVGCFSCHHQGVGAMTVALAREAGFAIDEELAEDEARATHAASRERYEALLVCDGVGVFGRGTTLLGLGARGWPRNDVTDVLAHFLAARQTVSGAWYSNEHRPPFEDSHVTATALTVRALQLYGPEGREAELKQRVERAGKWLADATPAHNEDRSMRLLGLAWTGADATLVDAAAKDLFAQQRADGGWAQLPTRASDAYATGQALVVLNQVAGVPAGDPAWRRGAEFLLSEQRADGSWFVETRRRIKGLKPRDSGFPYGASQFVSFLASSWATMALALREHDGGPARVLFGPPPARDANDRTAREHGLTELHRAAAFGTADELRCLLAEGADPNARGPRELTPLMLAVHDPDKVDALLLAGADPRAESEEWGFTPLLTASLTSGAGASVLRFLALGADVHCKGVNGANPLANVASMSDTKALRALAEAGGQFPGASLQNALVYAACCDDVETGRLLVELGADVDMQTGTFFTTPLTSAVIAGYERFTELMLALGADPEARDPDGMTALAWAAKVDPGHSRIVERLLRAGADPNACSDNGMRPLDWAVRYGNEHHARVLRAAGAGTRD